MIQLREEYNFDGILISLHGHNPNWRDDIVSIETNDKGESLKLKNGDTIFFPTNDLPQYLFKEPAEILSINDFNFDSLPNELDYIPVSQNLHFKIDLNNKFNIIDDIIQKVGDEYSVHGEITSPFDYLLDLLGYENALMALLIEPIKCKKILNHFTKLIKNLALEMCQTGIDAIKLSSPFAGAGFISPNDYKEFVLPYETEIVKAVRAENIHIYIHTCGAIDDRLELMFESGMSGIECLDPYPLGNVKLEDAVRRISDKGFIKGNIDSVNILLNGTKADIEKDVINRINTGTKKPGFILSTACSIAPEVKKENIKLLNEIIEKLN
ncbi:MAG: hypothetical protein KDC67_14755 [Ignavibacteriae bacterium]|nr:hypothetical protein [Ignavibacteriota bacterium]